MAKRYTDKQKTSILDKYHALRKSGETAAQAARHVRVSYLTLRKWESAAVRPAAGKDVAGKGTVADTLRNGAITLTTPGGYRIETDSAEQMAQLLNLLHR